MGPDPARREDDDDDDAALPMRRPKHLRATSRVCVFLKQSCDDFEEDEEEKEAKTTPPLVVVVVASILFSVFSKGGGRVVVLVRSSSREREKMGRSLGFRVYIWGFKKGRKETCDMETSLTDTSKADP